MNKEYGIIHLERKGSTYVGFYTSDLGDIMDISFHPKKQLMLAVNDEGDKTYWTCRADGERRYICR